MRGFKNFHFSGQKQGEELVLVVRRHWFDIIQQLFLVFIMICLLFASFLYLPLLFPILNKELFSSLFMFLENLFAMLIWIIFFLIWIDYYFDVWIITNRRIVNVDQKGLFSREVSELELEKIQDITTEVLGVIPTFMNYGDVLIQTAAEKGHFDFQKVPDPYAIKDLIMNLQKRQEREEAAGLGDMIQSKIEEANGV